MARRLTRRTKAIISAGLHPHYVSAAKTLCELARSGVTTPRLRKSLEQLKAWLPDAEQPLQQLAVSGLVHPRPHRLRQHGPDFRRVLQLLDRCAHERVDGPERL